MYYAGLNTNRSSGKVVLNSIVSYHGRIKRTASLVGIEMPTGRRRRHSSDTSDSTSSSDSDDDSIIISRVRELRAKATHLPRRAGGPPPPPVNFNPAGMPNHQPTPRYFIPAPPPMDPPFPRPIPPAGPYSGPGWGPGPGPGPNPLMKPSSLSPAQQVSIIRPYDANYA